MPAAEKTDAFAALVRRLGLFIRWIGLVGTPGVVFQYGWKPAGAFAFGVIAAYFNMRWLAGALNQPTAPRTAILALRFGLIGGTAYVILETFGISPLFILAGLLAAALAVILEILFQLFYART